MPSKDSSPIYFIEELPVVQLHHDNNDPFVSIAFARKLIGSMNANGKPIHSFFMKKGYTDSGATKTTGNVRKSLY